MSFHIRPLDTRRRPAVLLCLVAWSALTLPAVSRQGQNASGHTPRLIQTAACAGLDRIMPPRSVGDAVAGTQNAPSPKLVVQLGNASEVTAGAFSPDGRLLATGGQDNHIVLWDTASAVELGSFTANATDSGTGRDPTRENTPEITELQFSPDGRTLLGRLSDDDTQAVFLWDVATQQELWHREDENLTNEDGITSHHFTAFSPDSRFLVSAWPGGGATILDASSGQAVQSLPTPAGTYLSTAAFSPDGKYLLTASNTLPDSDQGVQKSNGYVRLWDVDTRRALWMQRSASVGLAQFSGSGDTVWIVDGKGVALSCVTATGIVVRRFGTSPLDTASISPDSRYLIEIRSVDEEGTVSVYDTNTDRLLWNVNGDEIRLCPDSRSLLVLKYPGGTSRGSARRLDLATGRVMTEYRKDAPVQGNVWEWSPDGRSLFTVPYDHDGDFGETYNGDMLLEAVSGRQERLFRSAFPMHLDGVSWSPDDRYLIAEAGVLGTYDTEESKVVVWDVDAGRSVMTFSGLDDASGGGNGSFVVSRDSRLLLVDLGSAGGGVDLYDIASRRLLHRFPGTAPMALSPDDRSVATTTDADRITISSASSGTRERSIAVHLTKQDLDAGGGFDMFHPRPLSVAVSDLDFSPDGIHLAAACLYQGTGGARWGGVQVLDVKTGRPAFQTQGRAGDISSLSYSPDGDSLLTSEGYTEEAHLWDAKSGKMIRAFAGQGDDINQAAFSLDGRFVVTGGGGFQGDATALLWSVHTGREVQSYMGHAGPVIAVAFSTDGRLVLTAGEDDTVRLWDRASGRQLLEQVIQPGGGWTFVAPDGRFDITDFDDTGQLHWVLPDAPFIALPLEIFMRQYYEPRLLPRLLAHDPTLATAAPSIADLNRVQPPVHITAVAPHPGTDPTLVDVTVTAARASATFHRDGHDVVDSTGVYDLSLFRDGQLVGRLPEGDEGATPVDLTADALGGTLTHTFTVRLPRDGSKTVDFSAYAFNVSQVKSETDRLTYTLPHPLPAVKGSAYVVSRGVNTYQDPRWDLRFAANDARRTVDGLTADLRASGRFANVVPLPLVSDDAGNAHDATRADLHAVLDRLAGHDDPADAPALAAIPGAAALPPARPEDLVILTFSCHGDNDPHGGAFYLFPSDIGPDQEQGLTDDLKAHAVSSDDLSLWLRGVDAGQIALVVDACHSAASVDSPGFKPGPMGSRGLGQLAYDKGLRVLAASQADDFALESDRIGDGLLTYALVHDGLAAGRADAGPRDGAVTLAKWLRYGAARVPALYRAVRSGAPIDAFGAGEARAVPLGRKGVALVNAPAAAAGAGLQQPALFDFNRLAQDPLLEVLPVGSPAQADAALY